jgi:hypothetical protein
MKKLKGYYTLSEEEKNTNLNFSLTLKKIHFAHQETARKYEKSIKYCSISDNFGKFKML